MEAFENLIIGDESCYWKLTGSLFKNYRSPYLKNKVYYTSCDKTSRIELFFWNLNSNVYYLFSTLMMFESYYFSSYNEIDPLTLNTKHLYLSIFMFMTSHIYFGLGFRHQNYRMNNYVIADFVRHFTEKVNLVLTILIFCNISGLRLSDTATFALLVGVYSYSNLGFFAIEDGYSDKDKDFNKNLKTPPEWNYICNWKVYLYSFILIVSSRFRFCAICHLNNFLDSVWTMFGIGFLTIGFIYHYFYRVHKFSYYNKSHKKTENTECVGCQSCPFTIDERGKMTSVILINLMMFSWLSLRDDYHLDPYSDVFFLTWGLSLIVITLEMFLIKVTCNQMRILPFAMFFLNLVNSYLALAAYTIYLIYTGYTVYRLCNVPFLVTPVNVFCCGVFDLLHVGHMKMFQNAKKLGTRLIVGVHNDNAVLSYKGETILKQNERYQLTRNARDVDEVITNAPLILTADFIRKHNINLVVCSEEYYDDPGDEYYCIAKVLGIFKRIERTPSISTSDIIQRLYNRYEKEKTCKWDTNF